MENKKLSYGELTKLCQEFAFAVRCGADPSPEEYKQNKERLELIRNWGKNGKQEKK